MKMYTLDQAKDLHIGKVGTPERDQYELEVEQAYQEFLLKQAQENYIYQDDYSEEEAVLELN